MAGHADLFSKRRIFLEKSITVVSNENTIFKWSLLEVLWGNSFPLKELGRDENLHSRKEAQNTQKDTSW
jgi:hypothetical protein